MKDKNVALQLRFKLRRSLLIVALVVIGMSLSACRLAREYDGWERPVEDIFMGFFVTIGNHDAFFGNERIYAVFEGTGPFTFPGIDGIPFFIGTMEYEYKDAYGTGSVTTSFGEVGPGIVSDTMHTHISDNNISKTLSGTLTVSPRLADAVFRFNPVYQVADGRVYIGQGGSSVTAARDSWEFEGRTQSFRMEESRTITENGVSQTFSVSVELGIAVMHPPERIVVLQMDEASRVINRAEYSPYQVPDEITPLSATAYIIVETHRNPELKNSVVRALYEPDDEWMQTFRENNNGVLDKWVTRINW
ncbi:MAG: hypothetical protein FWD90_03785 [Defluviitaleaceae bacterium]|nr:hypothetical protein [Defluviitaleaceae bacterium]